MATVLRQLLLMILMFTCLAPQCFVVPIGQGFEGGIATLFDQLSCPMAVSVVDLVYSSGAQLVSVHHAIREGCEVFNHDLRLRIASTTATVNPHVWTRQVHHKLVA